MSEDKELIRAFTEGADIHKRTAALVLGIDESKVSAEDRRMAKAINFGIVYGQTPFGLAKSLGIDRVQAKRFIDDYFHTYPGIKTYMEQILEEARRTGRVKTLAGRIRYLPDIQSRNPTLRNFAERTAINSPIQGTAADLIKVAMLNIDAKVLPQFPSVKLILQIHDELLFEVPNDVDAFALETALKEQMEDRNILKDWIGKSFLVPLKAEASLGPHWGALK
jgi:DNA polymerase-1